MTPARIISPMTNAINRWYVHTASGPQASVAGGEGQLVATLAEVVSATVDNNGSLVISGQPKKLSESKNMPLRQRRSGGQSA